MAMPKHLLLFAGITCIRMLTGCYASIIATSMPTLANNVDKNVAAASLIFSFRNIGIFVGGIVGNIAIKRLNPIATLAGMAILCGCTLLAIPEIKHFLLLNIGIFMLGFVNGFVDSIGLIIVIANFVPEVGAQLLGAFHMLYNIGAISGSAIMDRYIDVELERPCPDEEIPDVPNGRSFFPVDEDFPWSYRIPALITVPVAILLYVTYHFRRYEKLQQEKVSRMTLSELEDENKTPSTSRLKPFIGLYLLVIFLCSSTQQISIAYVHQYSRCSVHINATSTESANNMIYFWIFNSLGRVSMTVLVRCFSIRTLFALDCIGLTTCLIVLSIKAIITKSIFFIIINIFGFFIGAVTPCTIIYAASIFRIEKNHMWVIYVGQQLLPILNPIFCGNWMEKDLEGYIYFNLVTAGLATLFLPLLYHFGEKCKDKDIPTEQLRFTEVSGSVLTIPLSILDLIPVLIPGISNTTSNTSDPTT